MLNHESYADMRALLEELHITHTGEMLALEMGRPFRSIGDA